MSYFLVVFYNVKDIISYNVKDIISSRRGERGKGRCKHVHGVTGWEDTSTRREKGSMGKVEKWILERVRSLKTS